MNRVRAGRLPHASDDRLQIELRYLALDELCRRVGELPGSTDGPHRAVMARLIVTEEPLFLEMTLREPFHVRHAVPTGHDHAERKPVVTVERPAVQRPGED